MPEPDFRRCRVCGVWFMAESFSNDPCPSCMTREMAKIRNIRERELPKLGATGGMLALRGGTGAMGGTAAGDVALVAGRDTYGEAASSSGGGDMAKVQSVIATCLKCGERSNIWTAAGGYANEFCPICGNRLRNKAEPEQKPAKEPPRRRFKLKGKEKAG